MKARGRLNQFEERGSGVGWGGTNKYNINWIYGKDLCGERGIRGRLGYLWLRKDETGQLLQTAFIDILFCSSKTALGRTDCIKIQKP